MERLIASANEHVNIEGEQIKFLHKIFVYTLAEESRMGRLMPACLDITIRAMKNFPWCPDIQEYGCGTLSNATFTSYSPYYTIVQLYDGVKLAFDALVNHGLDGNIVQNATLFLKNISQYNAPVLYTDQAEERITNLCTVLCDHFRNRSTQDYCLSILIKTCEDPALISHVRRFFDEKPDFTGTVSVIAETCIKDMDSDLLTLVVVLVQALSEEHGLWDKLTCDGRYASLLLDTLGLPWLKGSLATRILSVLLKMCCEWEPSKARRPQDTTKACESLFSVLDKYPLDERVQEWGCAVLEGLFACRMHVIPTAKQAKIAVSLVYANEGNPTIIKSYFNMLWSAAHGNDERKLALDTAGAIKAATTVMKAYPEDIEMQIQGCGLIATLLSHKDVAMRAVRSKWTCGISQVISAMKKFPRDPSMQRTGMEALCNAIACNADIYFTYESMKIAVLNLAKFCDDLRIVSTALMLLRNLVYQDPLDQRFLKFGGLVAVVGVIRMNHLSSVCPLALSVLSVILGSKHCANAFEATWPGLLPIMLKRASSGFYEDDTILISVMRCILKVIQVIGVTTKSTIDTLFDIFRNNMENFQIVHMCCLIFEALAHYDAFINSPSKDTANELVTDACTRWFQSESLQEVVNRFIQELSRERIIIGETTVTKNQKRGMRYTSFKSLTDVTEFVLDKDVDSDDVKSDIDKIDKRGDKRGKGISGDKDKGGKGVSGDKDKKESKGNGGKDKKGKESNGGNDKKGSKSNGGNDKKGKESNDGKDKKGKESNDGKDKKGKENNDGKDKKESKSNDNKDKEKINNNDEDDDVNDKKGKESNDGKDKEKINNNDEDDNDDKDTDLNDDKDYEDDDPDDNENDNDDDDD